MIHAQTKAKLPLQWSLTSTAARHYLTLGYHREAGLSQLSTSEAGRIRRFFWLVYIADKNLSLRLGRPSTIHDYDVDILPCPISEDPGRAPWDLAFSLFCKLAKIQGEIYEKLYSPIPKKAEPEERIAVAGLLEARLIAWYQHWTQLDSSMAYDHGSFSATFGLAPVAYYSVLTLLHRGSTLSSSVHDISPSCFKAAHLGLEAHLTYCLRLFASDTNALSTYAYW